MVFSSTLFLFVYLPLVLGIYYTTPLKYRNAVLLITSLIFYGWGEPVYITIMILSTLIDYVCGMLVDKYRDNKRLARRFVYCSVAMNLSLLGFFKYSDFFIKILSVIPVFAGLKPLGVELPIGISFYTFQSMSYTIDVYRNDAPVQKRFVPFAAYVTVFPQLIAGPIVKYREIAEQLADRKSSVSQCAEGVKRFIAGLAKKVLIANNIGRLWDYAKELPAGEMSVAMAWLGITAFAFQIYFDFSGYSDMAIGLGKLLGFEFPENFNYPYTSRSVTEFWRRWHISLSTWFREYLYIPLGGNRHGKFKTYRNLFIVWALTGFWHGAGWNFLLWGVYFAVILMAEKAFMLKALDRTARPVGHAYTLILVWIGWVLFALEDLAGTGSYLSVMLGFTGNGFIDGKTIYYLLSFGPVLLTAAIGSTALPARICRHIERHPGLKTAVPVGCILLLVLCTAYLVDSTYNPFLYFRF